MYVFGLTGPTGAGKSTVAALLRKSGIYVADADKAARAIVKKGMPCLAEIAAAFGDDVLASDGTLRRRKLADIVFNDENKLKLLNRITHKYIKTYLINELETSGAQLAAIDGAVIIGSPVEELCRFITVVTADEELRIKRIMNRDGIDHEAAKARTASQPKSDQYILHARYTIENNDRGELLGEQVEQLCNEIKIAAKTEKA